MRRLCSEIETLHPCKLTRNADRSRVTDSKPYFLPQFCLKPHVQFADASVVGHLRTWKSALMQTNGFILIALLLATISRAGSPWYLPAVGPVGLRHDASASAMPVVRPSDPPQATAPTETPKPVEFIPELPIDPPTELNSTNITLLVESPAVEPPKPIEPATPLIGPTMDTNTLITPQMLMRYFTPVLNGTSRESVIIPQTGFTPARPPTPSSTVNYTQPK